MKAIEKPVIVFEDGGKRVVLVPPSGTDSQRWLWKPNDKAPTAGVVVEQRAEDSMGQDSWRRINPQAVADWLLIAVAKLAADQMEKQP